MSLDPTMSLLERCWNHTTDAASLMEMQRLVNRCLMHEGLAKDKSRALFDRFESYADAAAIAGELGLRIES